MADQTPQTVAISEGDPQIVTPEQMLALLRTMGKTDSDILDLIKWAADQTGGFTPRLDALGLLVLKPDAPKGEERWA